MQCYTGPYLLHIKIIFVFISFIKFFVFILFIKGFIKVVEMGNWIVAMTVLQQTAQSSLNILINY